MRKRHYPSDLPDAQWGACVAVHPTGEVRWPATNNGRPSRLAAGRKPGPTLGIIDGESVKTSEKGAFAVTMVTSV